MFTGIVQGIARIQSIDTGKDFKTFTIQFPEKSLIALKKGASIAINGTCLTATQADISKSVAKFDVIQETLSVTTLDRLQQDDQVNFERAAKFGDEIGGHLMSGHIHATVRVNRVVTSKDNHSIYFETPPKYQRYLFTKGFAGLNGCSLTLGEVNNKEFSVHLIPETLGMTTFKKITEGNYVNLEIDSQTQSIVDTVSRILEEQKLEEQKEN
jgi:riboflavin synthase